MSNVGACVSGKPQHVSSPKPFVLLANDAITDTRWQLIVPQSVEYKKEISYLKPSVKLRPLCKAMGLDSL